MREIKEKIEKLKNKQLKQEKLVVNAGLLKAGKSSLFNALAGKEIFDTDVIRATVVNKKVELEKFTLLDTPGLDACQNDDEMAFSGYVDADVILFVHNLLEGELNQIETDAIQKISNLFNNKEVFFKNVILVLSCKDQKEEYEIIKSQIEEQCKKLFGYSFHKIFCINSIGYLKGKKENKSLLVKDSGIDELLQAVEICMEDAYDLQQSYYEKEKEEIIASIDKEISKLEAEKVKYRCQNTNEGSNLKGKVQNISNKVIDNIKSKKLEVSKPCNYKYLGKAKDYKEYSSSYSARSAARDAISSAISKVARRAKEDAKDAVEQMRRYIAPEGVPTDIRNQMLTAYEEIRKEVGAFVAIKNFNIILNVSTESSRDLKFAYDRAKYVTTECFSSVSHYETSYSSNVYIDEDYRTKWVQGLFGEREKQITVYSYDAEGAIDDVGSDGEEIVNNIINDTKPAVNSEFSKIKDDLLLQFQNLIKSILQDIDTEIANREKQSKQKKAKLGELEQTISELMNLKQALK